MCILVQDWMQVCVCARGPALQDDFPLVIINTDITTVEIKTTSDVL